MLNELNLLADALEKANITPKEWHKDLKPLPKATAKKPCFVIYITTNGSISSITTMSEEKASNLRKWGSNAGDSFPGFNVTSLYKVTDEDSKRILRKCLEGKDSIDGQILKKWCVDANSNWDKNIIERVNKSLSKRPKELYNFLQNEKEITVTSLHLLVERVLQYPEITLSEKQVKNSFKDRFENYLHCCPK